MVKPRYAIPSSNMIHVSAEQRFSLYYAVLFGSVGASLPFAALWMSHAGITPAMIGIIVALPSVAMLATTISIGRWADKLIDRRSAIITGNWLILAAHLVLFLSTGELFVLLVWLVAGVALAAKLPITDAAALSLARQRGSDYARVRMFGSIGFVLMLTLAGYAYEHLGIGVFVAGLFIANVLRLLAAYALPRKLRSVRPESQADDGAEALTGSLYIPGILFTLLAGALINASHAMVYTYGILLWTQQGLSESLASLAIGIGVVVEVALMWWFKSLTRNVSARACLLIAATFGLVRWWVLASEPSWLMVFGAQALHGVSFGVTFLACAGFIARRVPEKDAARGQGLLATLSTACMAMATFVCGQFYDVLGSALYWMMGGLCLLAVGCVAMSYRYGFVE